MFLTNFTNKFTNFDFSRTSEQIYSSIHLLNYMKKNITFFISSLERGGIENYLLRFLLKKNESFNKIFVYCKAGKKGLLEKDYLMIPNVQIIDKKFGYLSIKSYFSIYKFLKKENISVVCDFTGTFSAITLFIANFVGIKQRICFYRGSEYQFKMTFLKNIYVKLFEFLVLRYATNILSNSYAALNNIFKDGWKQNNKFKVIYNGIDAETFLNQPNSLRKELGLSPSDIVLGHIGRYAKAKNHSTIVKTCTELCKQYNNLYFLFCGRDVANNIEKDIPKEYRKRFFIFEDRRDIPIVLNTIDIFYFPSLNEGQPNALIEAMIMDKKIIASNIAAIKECVPNEFQEFLIDPKSTKGAINLCNEYIQKEQFYSLRTWALTQFDYNKQFVIFLNYLI